MALLHFTLLDKILVCRLTKNKFKKSETILTKRRFFKNLRCISNPKNNLKNAYRGQLESYNGIQSGYQMLNLEGQNTACSIQTYDSSSVICQSKSGYFSPYLTLQNLPKLMYAMELLIRYFYINRSHCKTKLII